MCAAHHFLTESEKKVLNRLDACATGDVPLGAAAISGRRKCGSTVCGSLSLDDNVFRQRVMIDRISEAPPRRMEFP